MSTKIHLNPSSRESLEVRDWISRPWHVLLPRSNIAKADPSGPSALSGLNVRAGQESVPIASSIESTGRNVLYRRIACKLLC